MLTYMMHVSTHTHTWTHTLQHTSILQCMHAHTHGTHTHARMHVHTCKMLFFYISSSFCLLLSSKRIAKERAQCLSSLSGNQEFASLLSFKDCQFALHSSLYSSLSFAHTCMPMYTHNLSTPHLPLTISPNLSPIPMLMIMSEDVNSLWEREKKYTYSFQCLWEGYSSSELAEVKRQILREVLNCENCFGLQFQYIYLFIWTLAECISR